MFQVLRPMTHEELDFVHLMDYRVTCIPAGIDEFPEWTACVAAARICEFLQPREQVHGQFSIVK